MNSRLLYQTSSAIHLSSVKMPDQIKAYKGARNILRTTIKDPVSSVQAASNMNAYAFSCKIPRTVKFRPIYVESIRESKALMAMGAQQKMQHISDTNCQSQPHKRSNFTGHKTSKVILHKKHSNYSPTKIKVIYKSCSKRQNKAHIMCCTKSLASEKAQLS